MNTANVILSHQPAATISRLLAYWDLHVAHESIFLAYGGERAEFDRIEHQRKFYVEDPRLRTHDHQREFQSYSGVFGVAADYLRAQRSRAEFVHFAEYDHLPLVPDLNDRQVERLTKEGADVLGFHVQRVDDTNHPHFLYHNSNPEFATYWGKITRRAGPEVVLSMFGSGSLWRRGAMDTVASRAEPFPMYLEIYLPTLAHHLGYRVRDCGEQNRFVHNLGDRRSVIGQARADGAWTLHPVKELGSDA